MTHSRRCTTIALIVWLSVAAVTAQGSSPPSPYRPWVGVGLGWGTVTSTQVAGANWLLAASLELPLAPAAGVRIAAERIWSGAVDDGDISVRQLSADFMTRRTIARTRGCDSQVVVGIGLGLYRFTVESGPVDDPTQLGYQVTAGADCVGDRIAVGGAFGFRFIDAPEHPAFSSDLVIAPSLTMTVRIRF